MEVRTDAGYVQILMQIEPEVAKELMYRLDGTRTPELAELRSAIADELGR